MSSVVRRVALVVATGALTTVVALGVATSGPVGVEIAEGTTRPGERVPEHVATALVGTAHRSIAPQVPDGQHWETDRDACATLSPATLERVAGGDLSLVDHLASTGSPWPENPDCIYMGGYGIGPMNPITSVDEVHGLGARAVAVRDGQGDAVVLVVVDAEGWFWDYATKCDDCGIRQITERMGDELGIDPGGIVVTATHSHTAPDLLGGWGFVPDWYMQQVTTAVEDVIRASVIEATPAVLEVGETRARTHNRERRDTYRSAEEQQVAWLRALAVEDGRFVHDMDRDAPRVLATVGAYAAHPTTRDAGSGQGHGDWPVVFADRVAERFGGLGLHAMTGLGNMSAAGGTAMGAALADELPAVGAGDLLTDTDVRTRRITYRQPTTNVPLTALATPGFFDRPIDAQPAELRTGPAPDTAPCVSASPLSADVPVAAAMVGDGFALTAAPGEIFANVSNTIKERSPAAVTMPLGQANDALGYLPQSFELNEVGQQGLGFVAGGYLVVNYEDSYAIDRCFGDKVLEESLGLLADLATR